MKGLLLDTHTFIWWASKPEKLSKTVLSLCEDQSNILVVSVWEMQIKLQLGKLKFDDSLANLIVEQEEVNNLQILQINLEHVLSLNSLANHHKDTFDRLLIAQSNTEKLTILSNDSIFSKYTKNVIW